MEHPERANKRKRATHQRDLLERIKRQTGQLAAINTVVSAVSQTLDLNQALQTAMQAVLSVIPVESSGISLIDEKAGELVMRAQHGLKYDFVSTPMRIKLGHGLSGQAVSTGELVVIRGVLQDDPRLYVPAFAMEGTKAMVLAPMRVRGKVIGVLSVMSHEPYDFTEEELTMLRLIADQVGIAIDNARLFEAARQEQSRLEAVIQSTADAIIATDTHGTITLLNQAGEKLFNLSAADQVGKRLQDAPFPTIIRERFQQGILRTVGLSKPDQPNGANGDLRFEVQLAADRYLLMAMSPVYSQMPLEEEHTEGWVLVFQDVTHLKEAERARLQFVQQAAHDLRNPLGVTLSALTMLSRTWKNPTPGDQEVFSIALSGINRMQDLIDDLLNLEHIDSGVDFRHEAIHIPDLVERCAIDIGPVLQRKSQRLTLNVDQSLPPLYGDERWLYRALMNLLSNAHKYTPVQSAITIRAEPQEESVCLSVEDDGPGIPLEAQSRLFERFFRVRTTEKIPGTGLGLAMVKSVAEKHGGKALCHSTPGAGATFMMVMPLHQH
jgi:two-component system phosphate regulon sensor histidine kinase PhoR